METLVFLISWIPRTRTCLKLKSKGNPWDPKLLIHEGPGPGAPLGLVQLTLYERLGTELSQLTYICLRTPEFSQSNTYMCELTLCWKSTPGHGPSTYVFRLYSLHEKPCSFTMLCGPGKHQDEDCVPRHKSLVESIYRPCGTIWINPVGTKTCFPIQATPQRNLSEISYPNQVNSRQHRSHICS